MSSQIPDGLNWPGPHPPSTTRPFLPVSCLRRLLPSRPRDHDAKLAAAVALHKPAVHDIHDSARFTTEGL